MTLEDQYKLLVEAYYGISVLDEYNLKEYTLKDIQKLIDDFESNYAKVDYNKIKEHVKNNASTKTKLQSSLIVLNSIEGSMELMLLIKERLKKDETR